MTKNKKINITTNRGFLVIVNKILFDKILNYLCNDIDKLYCLLTCKTALKYKNSVKFDHFSNCSIFSNPILKPPSNFKQYQIENLNNGNDLTFYNDAVKSKKVEFQKLVLNPGFKGQSISLPNNLRTLVFTSINYLIDNFPDSLTSITFITEQQITQFSNQFPKNITKLNLTYNFYAITIPSNITHLRYHVINPHPYHNIFPLPPALKVLQIGLQFRDIIEIGSLPITLETLILPKDYSQPIPYGALPPSLRTLKNLNILINYPEDFLPKNLQHLHIQYIQNGVNFPLLPNNLKTLSVKYKWTKPLPNSLEKLSNLGNNYYSIGDIPDSVKEINFTKKFHLSLQMNILPKNLEILTLGNFNSSITPNSLPNSLTRLSALSFNQPLEPSTFNLVNLRTLEFGTFNQEIRARYLPDSITDLTFGGNFRIELKPNVLPKQLIKLTFSTSTDSYYNFQFKKDVLPKCLQILKLPSSYNHPFLLGTLPHSLRELYIPSQYNLKIDPNSLPHKLAKFYTQNLYYKHDPKTFLPLHCLFIKNPKIIW